MAYHPVCFYLSVTYFTTGTTNFYHLMLDCVVVVIAVETDGIVYI